MIRRAFILAAVLISLAVQAEEKLPRLDNPMSVEFLQSSLRPDHPRLVFTPDILAQLKAKLETDPVLQSRMACIRKIAGQIQSEPLLERKMEGRRLLHVSREMLLRINMLGAVYLVDKDPAVLKRINEELLAVCAFEDWNPSHFLDVGEMSLAVALALDWTDGDLPESTVQIVKEALIEKGLRAGWQEDRPSWAYRNNNWNQVCNGGLIAAAIAVAEDEPELAARTIYRALDGMPNALAEYAPDGIYPEGSSYWSYGTGYSVLAIAMLESAFGSDFGIPDVPGFMESAVFRLMCNAPSGMYYNFADCSDRRNRDGDLILAWFAARTGNSAYYEAESFMHMPDAKEEHFRHAGTALAWMSQFEAKTDMPAPEAWKGDGKNPVAVFTGGDSDPHHYYFGGKGGKAALPHGNMDAGSFVFELNGVRWSVDPGRKEYYLLEKTGFDLWNRRQDSDRWTLLAKNNFGHSTLTVNGEQFLVDGHAPLIDFRTGDRPTVAFDLTALYGSNVQHVVRRFTKDSPVSLVIQDEIKCSDLTETVTWQMLTTAEVEIVEGGAVLCQDGQTLKLENQSHPGAAISVVSLDPPPLELDRRIKGLKRLDINIPATAAEAGQMTIQIKLGEKQ
jgi:hypothetical protein